MKNFFSSNCFHPYSINNKLKRHEKEGNHHDYYYVEMPNENNKILKYNYGEKSLEASFIIYIDLEYLLVKNAVMSK